MKTLTVPLAAIATVVMVVAALWGWQNATALAARSPMTRPDVAAWAVRSAAVGLAAASQAVLLAFVVNAVYRRDVLTEAARVSALLVVIISAVAAVALGLAGR